jgi:hypothetical protein
MIKAKKAQEKHNCNHADFQIFKMHLRFPNFSLNFLWLFYNYRINILLFLKVRDFRILCGKIS